MVKNTVTNCNLFSRCSGRVLIVDDEQDIALVLKKGLETHGFEADAFSDPRRALRDFRAGSYDLVITDVRMPDMDGFQLYHKMRKTDSRVKVCFLSACEMYELKTPEVKCFIKKPVSIGDLLKMVRTELERR